VFCALLSVKPAGNRQIRNICI